jgi:sulfite exporter TauE/SafE
MPEFSLLAIFLTGLFGGVHCVGMCGGIVGALSLQLPAKRTNLAYHIAYNLGRISSYTVAGFIAGAVGASTLLLHGFLPVEKLLYLVANVMLVLLGLYLAGIWHVVTRIERAGGWLWRRIQPYMARLLPIRTVPQAFVVGLTWGWLPCGLVYSVLLTALASGSANQGALLMFAFGLGTVPNLLAMGVFAEQLRPLLQRTVTRRIAGLLVMGYGLWGLWRLLVF